MKPAWGDLDTAGRNDLLNAIGEAHRIDGNPHAVLSASEIAAECADLLSVPPTRNAVIGHIRRHPGALSKLKLNASNYSKRGPRKARPVDYVPRPKKAAGPKRPGKQRKPSMRLYGMGQKLAHMNVNRNNGIGAVSPYRDTRAPSGSAADKIPDPLNLTLMELQAGQCKWPVNDHETDGHHLFCGHKQTANSPYCEGHHELSIGEGSWREQKALHGIKAA